MFGKHYYLATRFIGGRMITHVWHCSNSTARALKGTYDMIIPLERKPRNAEIREGA